MKIAPSLLSADFANLASELKDIEKAGADLVHLDVMDGHFVPNLTFGCPIIKALRKHTTLPFDVHLMTEHPEVYFDDLAKAGAAMVSFPAEAAVHHDRLVHAIQEKGMKAGIALNPGTPLSMIEELLPILDFVLIMSVNPGFGGQKFMAQHVSKIRQLAEWKKELGLEFDIEVDGGVTLDNVREVLDAGANVIVAGSAVFGKEDIAGAAKGFLDIFKEYE